MADTPKPSGLRTVREIKAMAAARLQIPDTDTSLLDEYALEFLWEYRSVTNPVINEFVVKQIPQNRIIRQPVDMEDYFKIGWVRRDGKIQETGPRNDSNLSPTGITGPDAGNPGMIGSTGTGNWPNLPITGERLSGAVNFLKPSIVDGAYVYNNFVVGGRITENSSIRYKKDIETLEGGLDKVLAMRGVTYVKKDTGIKEVGLIAEELAEILLRKCVPLLKKLLDTTLESHHRSKVFGWSPTLMSY
jgi:hypothetical protein